MGATNVGVVQNLVDRATRHDNAMWCSAGIALSKCVEMLGSQPAATEAFGWGSRGGR